MDSPILSGSGSEASSARSDDEEENHVHEETDEVLERDKADTDVKNEALNEILQELYSLIRNLTTLFDMQEDDWNDDVYAVVKQFALNPLETILVIYYDDTTLMASTSFPSVPVHDLLYFIRTEECTISTENFFEIITFGNMNGSMEGSILNLLQHIYAPAIFDNSLLPEGVKSQLFSKLHETLGHLTDLHFKMYGLTCLYVPHEGVNISVDEASKQKELIRRLEGVMSHWLRQLRVTTRDTFDNSHSILLTPTDEYSFWEYRWQCLMLLNEQLDSSSIKHIIDILTLAQSSYLQQFKDLQQDMKEAIEEATSNVLYLQTLVKPCEVLSLKCLNTQIPEIINLIRKIWICSPYYNTDSRLVPLCRNLTNQVILQCQNSVDVAGIFESAHTRTAIAALKSSIMCCNRFRIIYDEMASFHTECYSSLPWTLDVSLVFGNMDSFVRRNYDLIEICEAMITFGWMEEEMEERPLFCGTKGESFAHVIVEVETRFHAALQKIAQVQNDILNVKNSDWQEDMLKFRTELGHLELILNNLLDSAMDEALTVEDALYSLQAFHHYSQRPKVFQLFEQKTTKLWDILLKEVHGVRQEVVPHPIRQANSPAFAGSALAAHVAKSRLQRFKESLTEATWLPDVREGSETLLQLDYVIEKIDLLIKNQHSQWTSTIEDNTILRLGRPLVRRSTSRPGLIETNFDISLKKLRNEIFHWQVLEKNIAPPAEQLITQWSKVRLLYENINSIVYDYNEVISVLSDEERLLFKELISQVDYKISTGFFKVNWTLDNIDEFITSCCKANDQLNDFVQEYKQAIYDMLLLCEDIGQTKLLYISPGTIYKLEQLEEHIEVYRTNAFIKIMEIYQNILKHLVIVFEGFEEVILATGIHWHNFVLRLDELLKQSLVMCVKDSMQAMLDALNGHSALLSVSLHLKDRKISFLPTLQKVSSLGNHFLPEVVGAFKVIPRIYDKFKLQGNNPPPFHKIIDTDADCIKLQGDINQEVSKNVLKIQDYLMSWEPYRKIWEKDRDAVVKEYEDRNPDSVDWEADINAFDQVATQVMQETTIFTIHFTRLDASPLMMEIAQLCNDWKVILCHVLLNKVSESIDRIYSHSDESSASILEEPKNSDDLKSSLNQSKILSHEAVSFEEIQRIEAHFLMLENNNVHIPPDLARKRTQLSKRYP